MHTRETEARKHRANGLGALAKQVTEHASALVRLELELAAAELKGKIAKLGLGIGLAIGAAIFLLFFLGFAFASAAAGLATVLPVWGALLIVTGVLLLVTAVLGVAALAAINKGTPPVPEQAIEEAKKTSERLKGDGRA